MPKASTTSAHFDAPALLAEVHKQDLGLVVTTNHPAGFKRILYKAARDIGLKVRIFVSPRSASRLFLLKPHVAVEAAATEETPDE